MNSAIVLAGTARIDDYHEGGAKDDADWRNVVDEIETKLVVKRCADRWRWVSHQKCVAIGWRTHDRFNTDIASSARPVFDHKLLAKSLR